MNPEQLKVRAAEINAAIADGSATDEMISELETVVSELETYAHKAELAARSVAAAASIKDAPVVTEDAPSTAGAAFVRSQAFKAYDGRGKSEAVEVRAFTGTADLVIRPSEVQVATAEAPLPLTGIVGRESVSSDAVVYTQNNFDSNAAAVAEGDVKPESLYNETEVSVAVPTIAHWVNMSRQALADAPRLQSIIDGKLRRGLAKKVEDTVATTITGGTYNTASDASLLAAIRKAVSVVEATGFTANTIVANPADIADLDIQLLTANQGAVRNSSFWGLNVITSSAVAEGTAYVGDFASAVTIFDRQSTEIFITDSHEGNFTKNIVTLLAETRAGVAVTNAAAIAKATVA